VEYICINSNYLIFQASTGNLRVCVKTGETASGGQSISVDLDKGNSSSTALLIFNMFKKACCGGA
jgi:hypothetical protein